MSKCTIWGSKESAELKKLSEYLKVLSDFNRLQIVCLLSQGERCVCNIFGVLNLPQNLVSHHLRVLKEAGIVEARKDSTWMRYQLNKKTLAYLQDTLARTLKVKKTTQVEIAKVP